MNPWLLKLRDAIRDPHIDAAAAMHRSNVVRELVEQVACGEHPSPERLRDVREMLDRDDALVTLFGVPQPRGDRR